MYRVLVCTGWMIPRNFCRSEKGMGIPSYSREPGITLTGLGYASRDLQITWAEST